MKDTRSGRAPTRNEAEAWRELHRQLAKTRTLEDAKAVAAQTAPPHARRFYTHLRSFVRTLEPPRHGTRSELYVYNKLRLRFASARDTDAMNSNNNARVFRMAFASVYPHYVAKVEKKGRTKDELHAVIRWLTGYDENALQQQIEKKVDFETFFAQAPRINPNTAKITGVICGCRVEEIEDKLMQKIRYLDKLVDELAKGRKMEKILRA